MITAHYSCSQSALYQIAAGVIQSLSNHMEPFCKIKTKYTQEYIASCTALLSNAEMLPDYKTLLAQSETNYKHLTNALAECTLQWQQLKRYIKTAYDSSEHKTRLEQAGASHYKGAIARNWNETNALLIATKNFLSSQTMVLTAHQNMPPNFAVNFIQAYTNFSKYLLTFRQSEREIKTGTDAKLKANNALFALTSEICQDGQFLFKSNKALKEQFVFNTILQRINKPKNKELHRSDTSNPPESANIHSLDGYHQNSEVV